MNYKILFAPKIGDSLCFEKEFMIRSEAEAALELIVDYTRLLHDSGLMPDYPSDGLILERNQDGLWVAAGSGEICDQRHEANAERDALRSKLAGARDALREAAKQFRCNVDPGHASVCDGHADALTELLYASAKGGRYE